MVIKPHGYAIWEAMQAELDRKFKATGHVNAYFPLFVPKSYLSREAAHVEGFAKECAVVTHHRLKNDESGQGVVVDPDARLEEELIVRPTSETIIWNTYRNWIQSYRDLPLLINQWANVVRWELRTRLFLRTAEFLWQEGHTAHATEAEAIEEAEQMLDVYTDFVENFMGIPVIQGVKTANERFAGAVETYCIEALMQDRKALQAGTSHYLGQNFAKAFDCTYLSQEGKREYVYATSWGVSTRLIGALIMTHSDDRGLVLPPRLAPVQVAMVPIYRNEEQHNRLKELMHPMAEDLRAQGFRVKVDDRDTHKPGWKFAEYELQGVPLRIAIGPRDLENGTAELARRDTGEKETLPQDQLIHHVGETLEALQQNVFRIAQEFRQHHTHQADDWKRFEELIAGDAGFVYAHWDGTTETELRIKELTKATIRCIPLRGKKEEGKCILTGRPSNQRVIFAKAY
jgi:prolyl-tRNA synthetase